VVGRTGVGEHRDALISMSSSAVAQICSIATLIRKGERLRAVSPCLTRLSPKMRPENASGTALGGL
jgi:hypothetical protein